MTTASDIQNSHREKFKSLLRGLFQFDCAELDFGIYRIMNHKRAVIDSFIDITLPDMVSQALETGDLAVQQRAQERLIEVQQQLLDLGEHLGVEPFEADGRLSADFHDAPIGQKYLEAKEAAKGGRGRGAIETAIYNHLYKFFSRYYQDGDFISKRRYSRSERYAIPYNGQEVYLHWANSDQYYVKTDEYFKNYDWKTSNGVKVKFLVRDASLEQNNNRGDKRFFMPALGSISWDSIHRTVEIPFEYRPLSESEKRDYGSRNQQEKIIGQVTTDIPARIGSDAPDAVGALTETQSYDSSGEPISRLEHHLRQYTRRNDSDFFIHKDLRGFLLRELNFYIKNEVINLDELTTAGEVAAEGWFQQMRLINDVGSKIIEFLAQIEEFQKKIWEKKKFVIDTQYCVAMSCIPSHFHAEIVENDAQWEEWHALFGISEDDRCAAYLQLHSTLMLDTRHFSVDFVDRLLASYDDLTSLTDGLLICGENWQSLNLLQGMYAGRLDCLYADPPYNTNENTFLYKNNYKDSSWITMMSDRILLSRLLLAPSGVLQVAINDTETHFLRALLDRHFGQVNRAATIAAEVNPAGQNIRQNMPALSHDYTHIYANDIGQMKLLPRKLTPIEMKAYTEEDSQGFFLWDNLRRRGGNSRPADRPGQVFPLFVNGESVRVPDMDWDESTGKWTVNEHPSVDEEEKWPIDPQGEARIWRVNPDGAKRDIANGYISVRMRAGRKEIVKKSYMPDGKKPKTLWYDSRYSATTQGTKLLNDILGSQMFS